MRTPPPVTMKEAELKMIEVIHLQDENDGAAFFAIRGLGRQGCADLLQCLFELFVFYPNQQSCSAPPQKSTGGGDAGYAEIVRGERL